MKSATLLKLIAIPAIFALVIVYQWWTDMPMHESGTMDDMSVMTSSTTAQSVDRQPLYWVAPMDPNYRRNEPGLSPMGMALIPVYESGDTITVSASIQQNLGVRTAVVTREDFAPTINAVGTTGWDESSIQILHTRAEGWLEVFNLASVGDQVQAGEVMYELFAPTLVSAQHEYLTARNAANNQLIAVARDRLATLGFTAAQIDELERTAQVRDRLPVRADRNATITAINVRQGTFVKPETPLATLASLDKVWVDTEIFESKAGWIAAGLPVAVSFAAYPGTVWNSTIAYVYPNLEATTRSLRVRIVIENSDQRLRPNMFASVRITATPQTDVLTVPREAVIRAGSGERVIIALGEGRFEPRVVRTGITSGTRMQIESGLAEGEMVVTSGQFLLDSEANGEQAFARLAAGDRDAGAALPTTAMEMPGGMPMAAPAVASATPAADPNADADTPSPVYRTTGVIRQIIAGTSVTFAHEPVTDLGWPAMVMAFQVPAQMELGDLGVGDAVEFEFVITAAGGYQLATIAAQGGTQ